MRQHRTCLHGTYLCYKSLGIMITGKPGVGKSQLAYALLKHGFQLVADDLVIMVSNASNEVMGFAPKKSRGLIWANQMIDVRETISSSAYQSVSRLNYFYHLYPTNIPLQSSSQTPTITYHQLLGLSFLQALILVAPNEPLSNKITTFMNFFWHFNSAYFPNSISSNKIEVV